MKIYCIAIGGTGMAPLACLLQQLGHEVSGSDGPLYPPMSDLLAKAGIVPFEGWDPARLGPQADLDLVVVGNAVPRSHPEAVAVESSGIERISMPQAIARFLLPQRRSLVITGTHGKTTTTSMAAWVYEQLGTEPGYLVGGWPIGLEGSFKLGAGERFLLEGDEYNCAYFDRGAKFLHYQPETAVITSVEWDHADLYPTPESFRAAFSELTELIPPTGHLVACADEPEVLEIARRAACRVTTYGTSLEAEVRIADLAADSDGMEFRLEGSSALLHGVTQPVLRLAVWGEHNAANATAVWCAARRDGHEHDEIAAALAGFRGVRRRLEEIGGAGGITVVDDFAHHPTEVRKSIDGLRRRYPGRRLLVAFEPRSLSAGRALLHDAYCEAFARASVVALAPIFHRERLAPAERLDLARLVRDLEESGVQARTASVDQLRAWLLGVARAGDVLATMSSGSFERLAQALLADLEQAATVDEA